MGKLGDALTSPNLRSIWGPSLVLRIGKRGGARKVIAYAYAYAYAGVLSGA